MFSFVRIFGIYVKNYFITCLRFWKMRTFFLILVFGSYFSGVSLVFLDRILFVFVKLQAVSFRFEALNKRYVNLIGIFEFSYLIQMTNTNPW